MSFARVLHACTLDRSVTLSFKRMPHTHMRTNKRALYTELHAKLCSRGKRCPLQESQHVQSWGRQPSAMEILHLRLPLRELRPAESKLLVLQDG
jgi:hypothetical protein